MTNDVSSSSDSSRREKPLLSATAFHLHGPIELELGGRLPEVTVAYETRGRLNPACDNAVLIC